MTTRNDLHERMKTVLQDSQGITWSETELDEGLRMALNLYNSVSPHSKQAALVLEIPGREILLESLTGLVGVTEVWWPYDPENPETPWPPNKVAGFRLWWDGGKPVLFLSSFKGRLPHPGEIVRIWYACLHTIEGLDGALTTTLPESDTSLIVLGAAGFAASSACLDRGGTLQPELLENTAQAWLEEFHDGLDNLRLRPVHNTAEPWGEGWQMDCWEAD